MLATIAASDIAVAEVKRSGCEVIVYWDSNYSGEAWRTTSDFLDIPSRWNDQISSIVVISGMWDFFWDRGYRGEVITLPPGAYPGLGPRWNDQISSFRCARPTG